MSRAACASRPIDLTYWTLADQSELDCALWELVSMIDEHRPLCETCAAGFPPCPIVGEAIEAVLEWRERRALVSKAEALRRRHLYARRAEVELTPDRAAA